MLAACSDSPEEMITSARSYIAQNNYSAATIQLKNALQKDARNAEGRFLLGWIFHEQENYPAAALELRRALEAGYPRDDTVPLLARSLVRAREYDRLLQDSVGFVLSRPEAQAAVLVSVGDALAATRKPDEARRKYMEALAAHPDNGLARVGLARLDLVRDRNKAPAAAEEARRIIARDPNLLEGHLLLSDALFIQGKASEAVAAMRTTVNARPDSMPIRAAFLSMLLTTNDLDNAAKELEQLERLAPKHPITQYARAYLAFRGNDLSEARTRILEVTKIAPGFLPGQLLAGAVLVQSGEYALAQTYLDTVLQSIPGQPLARSLKAAALMETGQADRALDLIQPLLGERQSPPGLLMLAGQAHLAKGNTAQAREYFQRAASIAPGNADARARLGTARLVSGEIGLGFDDLEAASRLDQNSIQADLIQVFAHLRRNEPDLAMKAFAVVERKRPNEPQTWVLKGGLFQARGNIAEARAAYEKALALRPGFLSATINLARMDLAAHNVRTARGRFDQLLAQDPQNAEALLAYAGVLQTSGAKPAEVLAMIERAANAAPGQLAPKLALVRFHLMQHDTGKAKGIAQQTVAAWPADPRALEALARTQAAAGDMQQASATVNTLAAQLPGSPAPHLLLAELQLHAKNTAGAEQSLHKAVSIKPDDPNAQRQLIGFLASKKDFDGALRLARAMQKQQNNAVLGYGLEGNIQIAAGRVPEAITALRKAYAGSASADLVIRLHALLTRGGQSAEADRLVADWFRKVPGDTVVRAYLAERTLGARRYAESVRLYKELVALTPGNPLILNNLAWAAWQSQDPQAQSYAEQALRIAPDHPAILDTLGMIQIGRGDGKAGIANIERAVELAPDQLGIHLNLVRAYVKLGRKEDARRAGTALSARVPAGSPLAGEVDALLKSP
jgi:putative PEP-CTERM system TPR-repeat lipoprotein